MTDAIGYMAGFLLMLSFLPQVIKTIRTRTVEGLSVTMLVITFLSGAFYEVYAILLELTPLIIMNGIFTLLVGVQLVMTVSLRRSQARRSPLTQDDGR